MCLFPTIIRNKKYTRTIKNGGDVPPMTDKRVQWLPVGCGECMECTKQKQRGWQARLLEDIRTNKNGKFITLTFSTKSIIELQQGNLKETQHIPKLQGYDRDNAIAKAAVRLFLERWRKQFKKSCRHFLVTELGQKGETEHIHLHGILWTNEQYSTIRKIWAYGYIYPRDKQEESKTYINERSINYIVKYISKKDALHKYYKSIILTSAGIGRNYTDRIDATRNKFDGAKTKETYTTRTGHTINLPIYWRNKIYSEDQREKLWIQKIDKQERWVCGIKVKTDKPGAMKQFYKLLDYYRRENAQLGYGTGQRNWQQETYERDRRNLINEERIRKYNSNSRARIITETHQRKNNNKRSETKNQ